MSNIFKINNKTYLIKPGANKVSIVNMSQSSDKYEFNYDEVSSLKLKLPKIFECVQTKNIAENSSEMGYRVKNIVEKAKLVYRNTINTIDLIITFNCNGCETNMSASIPLTDFCKDIVTEEITNSSLEERYITINVPCIYTAYGELHDKYLKDTTFLLTSEFISSYAAIYFNDQRVGLGTLDYKNGKDLVLKAISYTDLSIFKELTIVTPITCIEISQILAVYTSTPQCKKYSFKIKNKQPLIDSKKCILLSDTPKELGIDISLDNALCVEHKLEHQKRATSTLNSFLQI